LSSYVQHIDNQIGKRATKNEEQSPKCSFKIVNKINKITSVLSQPLNTDLTRKLKNRNLAKTIY